MGPHPRNLIGRTLSPIPTVRLQPYTFYHAMQVLCMIHGALPSLESLSPYCTLGGWQRFAEVVKKARVLVSDGGIARRFDVISL